MAQDWYYAVNNKQSGPVSFDELRDLAAKGRLNAEDLVWQDGMPEWVAARTVKDLMPRAPARDRDRDDRDRDRDDRVGRDRGGRDRDDFRDDRDRDRGRGRDRDYDDDYDDRDRGRGGRRRMPPGGADKKIAAGLCGILLGGFGIHKFILGFTTAGIIQLVLCFVTCGMSGIIGLVEGIIYLTKSDEEFYELYVVQKKEWF